MADIYDRVAPSVALVYDITLRSTGPGGPQAVEQPEGNGSGFVWDKGRCGGRRSLLGLAVLLPRQLAACASASSALAACTASVQPTAPPTICRWPHRDQLPRPCKRAVGGGRQGAGGRPGGARAAAEPGGRAAGL